jgi:tetratricopeptide (TPR) repeat protein
MMLIFCVDVLALANHLDGLPLAIVIAGAFMRETGTSITEYLDYYRESWTELQLRARPGRQYQQGNLLQTWCISYKEIQKRDPDAAKLLLLLARYDNRDIWYELVRNCRHCSDVPAWLERAISSSLAFKLSLKSLIAFSLLETKQQLGSYTIHPVVQDWCHHIASRDVTATSTQLDEMALISVGYSVPSPSDRNYSELQERLFPHTSYIRHWNYLGDHLSVSEAFHGLGNLYFGRGSLKEAEKMYQRALVGKEKALGPVHTVTLGTVNNLGTVYSEQGKLKEAEEMYQRALSGRALGPDHAFTLDIFNNLGCLYTTQGRLKEAEDIYQRALTDFEKTTDPEHTSILHIFNNLGNVYSDQGKLKEAEEIYQRALAGKEKALGSDHMTTLETVNNLGNLYKEQGKLEEAEEMCQRALAGYEKALGPHHTTRAPTFHAVINLGNVYFDQGRLSAAGEMYQRALAGYERILGPDHMTTLDTVNNLGNFHKEQGKLEEAEEMYQRALAGYEKALGPHHKIHAPALNTFHNLANLYLDQGRLDEAEEMYQRTLAGYELTLGSDHDRTWQVIGMLDLLALQTSNSA